MRLFLDECVSPRIADPLNADGHVVTALRDVGGLGEPDHKVLRRCIDEDFVLVTQDARDFRNLVAREEIHPGLIILPNLDRQQSEALLSEAINYLDGCGDPMDLMVNRVLEIAEDGSLRIDDLPTTLAPPSAEPSRHRSCRTSSPGPT